ncbi:hypothetical protein conserved [Entamoeba histolytica]|uniref:Uncharacterized protein n=2 Tax=Entamoeba histolytica TaxID=5759 RepID=C4M592_ENTH1|nr:hypothetical protein, conserved [Entamoeba histolytica HM-1:IMSS]EAL45062.1 hypothetical protein, conserved [Entamoeba histolytica HM-1:IMSS]GAT96583.1 hypothetical protein conserved [Entamoeba histolytica]|eukprot:XP_650444.1 hypothetical protein, conserved [Entamoeba histolytica HM-1:IMSS]
MKGIIGTHASNFHCDDVTGCVFLKFTDEYKHHRVIRTLNQEELNKCDLVFDVGGVYDPSINRFDHHQRGFNETYSPQHTITLSACGLLFKHFGEEIVKNVIALIDPFGSVTEEQICWLKLKIYNTFVLPIDAGDNGIDPSPTELLFRDSTNLPSRVAKLNAKGYGMMRLEQFLKAQELVKKEFIECVSSIYFRTLPSFEPTRLAFCKRFEYDSEGRVMVLNEKCSWRDCLTELEDEEASKNGIKKEVLYVISHDDTRGQWGCIATSLSPGSFKMRKPFPQPWRGLRDKELEDVCKIKGAIFTHNSGFLACNATQEGMIKMAQLAAVFDDQKTITK